jgi:hypothetical protein
MAEDTFPGSGGFRRFLVWLSFLPFWGSTSWAMAFVMFWTPALDEEDELDILFRP